MVSTRWPGSILAARGYSSNQSTRLRLHLQQPVDPEVAGRSVSTCHLTAHRHHVLWFWTWRTTGHDSCDVLSSTAFERSCTKALNIVPEFIILSAGPSVLRICL